MTTADITPAAPVDKSGQPPIDRTLVETTLTTELAGEAFDTALATAVADIERMGHLLLWPGTYRARFQTAHLGASEPLILPGTNCVLTALTDADDTAVAYSRTWQTSAGSVAIVAPDEGWPSAGADGEIIAAFTAGGQVPLPVQQAVALQMEAMLEDEPDPEHDWSKRKGAANAAMLRITPYAYRIDW